MIWTVLLRTGTMLSVGSAVLHLYDTYTREINATRIYRTSEAARFLGINRKFVIKLIRSNKIRAKMVDGNYRIMGQSIIEYMNQ